MDQSEHYRVSTSHRDNVESCVDVIFGGALCDPATPSTRGKQIVFVNFMIRQYVKFQFDDYEDANSGNSVQGRGPSMDVGQFPYKRGERPIFNFDQGDEV